MKYITGTIYSITYEGEEYDIVYIGSTIQKVNKRWSQHRKLYRKYLKGGKSACSIYKYFKKFGLENFKFQVIKKYPVQDQNGIFAYEQLWINKTKCVNKQDPLLYLFKIKKSRVHMKIKSNYVIRNR